MVAFLAVGIALIVVLPYVIRSIEWMVAKFTGSNMTWGEFQDIALGLFLLAVLMIIVYGFLALALRFAGVGIYRNEIRGVREDIAEIKERLTAIETALGLDVVDRSDERRR